MVTADSLHGAEAPGRLTYLAELAGSVPDPELPVITLGELGVLRRVSEPSPGHLDVELTPTYTGCPAIEAMASDIERALYEGGAERVTVRTVLTPAWSTDDISPEGRRKLAAHGIAPPRHTAHAEGPVTVGLSPTRRTTPEPGRSPGFDHTTIPVANPRPTTAPSATGLRTPEATPCAPHSTNSHSTDSHTTDSRSAGPRSDVRHGRDPGHGTDPVRCPNCGSADTVLLARFSSTACKALRRCELCREPFDHFKEM